MNMIAMLMNMDNKKMINISINRMNIKSMVNNISYHNNPNNNNSKIRK